MNSVYQALKKTAGHKINETALIYESEGTASEITYGEFQSGIDKLSEYISEKFGKNDRTIGVCLRRSPRTLIAMLAIWNTGNIYVPIDRTFPKKLKHELIIDADISVIISEEETEKNLPKGDYELFRWENQESFEKEQSRNYRNRDQSSLQKVSFILYTSGTTGLPKGVKHTQYVIMNQLQWYWKNYPYNRDDVLLQRTNVGHIPFMCEAVGGLLKGIKTIMIGDEEAKDVYRIAEIVDKYQITRILLVPSQLNRLLSIKGSVSKLSSLKMITLCGEQVPPELYTRLFEMLPHVCLLNDYGSTETGMMLAAQIKDTDFRQNSLPGFLPISNIRPIILNENLKKCNINEKGFLYVQGKSVMKGYTQPELNKDSFIRLPGMRGHMLYRTGELAEYTKENKICVLGRADRQIKIRGMRIEPSSVEFAIMNLKEMKECSVLSCGNSKEDKKLTACIVCGKGQTIKDKQIRKQLRKVLPDYMIPVKYVRMKKLPKTHSGKIRREELETMLSGKEYQPKVKEEGNKNTVVRKIAAELLQVQEAGIKENQSFQEMGFDSLSLVDLAERLNRIYEERLSVTDIFNYPTIEKLQGYLKTKQQKPESLFQKESMSQVAVIGMSARFSDADNLDELWELLKEGRSGISGLPKEREADFSDYRNIKGGFLQNIKMFDGAFFGLSADECAQMDPQQRLCLEECFHALEDAGCTAEYLKDRKTAVFAGAREGDYKDILKNQRAAGTASAVIGCDAAMLSARLCYLLDMKGAALTLDTACSSSLSALHLACRSVSNKDCEIAVACGVNIMNTHAFVEQSAQLGILSKSGELCSFDEQADGTVIGEGVSVVVLKNLSDAVRDKNHIYGIIAGTGMNQDGRTNGITAPNGIAQVSLMQEVYRENKIDTSDVSYIECHSTGTVLGDPVEAMSLKEVFRNNPRETYLGSIKPNIGHTLAASGIAGVIKVLLSMKYGIIPPAVNFQKLNHHIDFTGTKLAVNKTAVPWNKIKMAAVNSFGFSGTNVHVVLRAYEERTCNEIVKQQYYLVPISAKTNEARKEKARQLKNWLRQRGNREELGDIAYTLQVGRDHYACRKAYIAGSVDELLEQLESGKHISKGAAPELLQKLEQYESGKEIDQDFWGPAKGKLISMPGYPFQRDCYYGSSGSHHTFPIYIKPFWKESKIIEMSHDNAGITAVFSSQKTILTAFKDCIKIRLSSAFRQISENSFETGKGSEDFKLLLKHIIGHENKKIRFIYVQGKELELEGSEVCEKGISPLLKLMKACMEVMYGDYSVELLYAYPGELTDAYSYYAAVSAFFQSLQMENMRFHCKAVEVADMELTEGWQDMLLAEDAAERAPVLIRYDGGRRYEKTLCQVMPEKQVILETGTYIITGGMGGIGSILAEEMLKECRCTVILLGRSLLEGSRKKKYEDIKSRHPALFYYSADVTDRKSLEDTFGEIRKLHGGIRGIIHCAGIIKDKLFVNKPLREFLSVAAVKSEGIRNLHTVTAEDRLDFFIAFSSITSVLGNYGQTDYGYGNGFMDSFMKYRNRLVKDGLCYGKSQSIQWPFWANGGMKVPAKELKAMKDEKGMFPIEDRDGIPLLKDALGIENETVAVFYGEEKQLQAYLKKKKVNFNEAKKESFYHVNDDYQEYLGYVTDMISRHTGIEAENIDPAKQFDEFNLDSLTILSITEAMEKKLGKLSKTLFYECQNINELVEYLLKSNRIQTQENAKKDTRRNESKIAIVGMHGSFPESKNLEVFWNNLWTGRDCIREIPKERFELWGIEKDDWDKRGGVYAKWAGLVENINQFDPLFFRISPKEAQGMDPQERLFLETVWELLQLCGYGNHRLKGENVGVFAGTMWNDYMLYGLQAEMGKKPSANLASIANRVSYVFDFKGPSMSINTMCSSSLAAVWAACESLRSGSCEYAVAGGVNLISHPYRLELLCQGKFASSHGKCRSFGAFGDGYVPGEGSGAVLLKPLNKAVEDGDHIYGVILDVSLNHGGRTSGYTVPNPVAQARLIASSIQKAGISPLDISYLEAHGTGTSLGDPIEVEGIARAFAQFTDKKQYCPMGSVKSNIGHLEAAAGIASLLKVLMQMHKKKLVPSLHAETLNPNIVFEQTPVYVQKESMDWVCDGKDRIAGISSFGAGGTGGFMLVEEYYDNKAQNSDAVNLIPENKFHKNEYWTANPKQLLNSHGSFLGKVFREEIKDHKIGGQIVCPASAVIKLIYDFASEYGLKQEEICIEELLFLQPIIMNQEVKTIRFVYHFDGDNLDFKLFCTMEDESPNARGNIIIERRSNSKEEFYPDVLDKYEYQMDAEEFYEKAFRNGIFYGKSHQTVETIWINGSSAASYQKAGGFVQALDGVLQTCIVLNDELETFVPYLVEGIRFYGSFPDSYISYAIREGQKMRLKAMDREKKVFLSIDYFALRKIKGTEPPDSKKEKIIKDVSEVVAKAGEIEWKDIHLDVPFENYGLDSLMLMDMEEKLVKKLGRPVKNIFFKCRNIRECAEELLREQKIEPEDEDVSCLSEGQKGILAASMLFPKSCGYNTSGAFVLRETVDEQILEAALRHLILKHEGLLSSFPDLGNSVEVAEELKETLLQKIICANDEEMMQTLKKTQDELFSLSHGPLYQAVLFVVDHHKQVLFLKFHHIVYDGISSRIFVQELQETYHQLMQGKIVSSEIKDRGYRLFSKQEREYQKSDQAEQDEEYWMNALPLALYSPGWKKEESKTNIEGTEDGTFCMELDSSMTKMLTESCQKQSIGLFTKSLAAYMILLYRYGDSNDIRVGVPVSVRNEQLRNAVGNFINMVVIRRIMDKQESMEELSQKLQITVSEALEHRRYPYQRLIRKIAERDNMPVLQLFFAAFYMNHWSKEQEDGFIDHQLTEIHQHGEYDFVLEMIKMHHKLLVRFKYNKSIFTEEMVSQMAEEYKNILLGRENKPTNFLMMFEEQARLRPQNTAVVFGEDRLTYQSLYRYSQRAAGYFTSIGIKRNDRIGIFIDRSFELLISMIGIQMAGGVYIPMDPDYPKEKLRGMVRLADLNYLVTDSATQEIEKGRIILLDDIKNALYVRDDIVIPKQVKNQPEDLAYILFTSGSTGNPKGVMIKHEALGNLLYSIADITKCSDNDYFLAVSTVSFDISGLELYLMLTVGGTVEILPKYIAVDGMQLRSKIDSSPVTMMQATPGTWQMLFEAGWQGNEKLKAICGGEALHQSLADKLRENTYQAWNAYGPTETTIWSMMYELKEQGSVFLGKPIANTFIYVLDEKYREVGPLECGELYIGGRGLAVGYLNNEKETADKFISLPHLHQQQLYKTGDIVKIAQNGQIEYVGRSDEQIKRNGYRIEPVEIEEALMSVNGMKQAVVVAIENNKTKQLAAFLIAEQTGPIAAEELKTILSRKLMPYMIPEYYTYVAEFPLMPNQKVDRRRLMEIGLAKLKGRADSKDNIRAKLRHLAADKMNLTAEDMDDEENLGRYGFDSVSFTWLSAAVNECYGIHLSPSFFYTVSTIHEIAEEIYKKLRKSDGTMEKKENMTNLSPSDKNIAVIGIGLRLPDALCLEEFWENLKEGKNSITKDPDTQNWGAFLKGRAEFDAGFFHISAREARLMDPQQRIMLEVVHHAIENAGYNPDALWGKSVGVYIGATSKDYLDIILKYQKTEPHTLTGITGSIIANRISFHYNFTGPSEVIDTACSGGLTAVCRAVADLRSGVCDYAIAGGVNILCSDFPYEALKQADMLSKDGKLKSFDAKADGYVRGEGAVAFLLRPFASAVTERDTIYSVIRGVSVNHCGRSTSLTAPNARAQKQVIQRAWEDAGISLFTAGYMECHGTGTALGDPIEIQGLAEAFADCGDGPGKSICEIGSVKQNIGHLEAAAGVAGMLKLLLCIYHKIKIGNNMLEQINPEISLQQTPFAIHKNNHSWDTRASADILRRGGVSAFGFGGSNAHVVLEEYVKEKYVKEENRKRSERPKEYLMVLSAEYEQGIQEYLKQLYSFLLNYHAKWAEDTGKLEQIAYTLQTGRKAYRHRLAILVSSFEQFMKVVFDYITYGSVTNSFILPKKQQHEEYQPKEKGALTLAGQRWVEGEAVDWKEFYDVPPEKISLPGYPFLHATYWLYENQPETTSSNSARPRYFIPSWEEAEKEADSIGQEGMILVLYSSRSSGLKKMLKGLLNQENTIFANLQDYIADGGEQITQGEKPDSIYYLIDSHITDNTVSANEDYGCIIALMHILQNLKEDLHQMDLCILTSGAYRMDREENALQMACGMFARTAEAEWSGLTVRSYDLDMAAKEPVRQDMQRIVKRVGYREHVRIKNGIWEEQKLKEIIPGKDGSFKSSFREHGVYLIVGMGGIGVQIGLYLARIYHAVIIFAGRRAEDAQISEKLEAIKKAGGNASYIQTDITDFHAAQYYVKCAFDAWGKADGVIFCAMVLKDRRIANMTDADVKEVIGVKMKGISNMAQICKAEEITSLILISSLNSFVCNPGQANYSAACAASDGLAGMLGKMYDISVKIINFSYWGENGAIAGSDKRKRLTEKGVFPITDEEGMKAIEYFMASDASQWIVYKGEEYVLRQLERPGKRRLSFSEMDAYLDRMETLAAQKIMEYVQSGGIFKEKYIKYTFHNIQEKLKVTAQYIPLLRAFLYILEQAGCIRTMEEDIWEAVRLEADSSDIKLWEMPSEIKPYLHLLERCTSHYHDVLSGKIHYTDVLFPEGDKAMTQQVYTGNAVMDYYNRKLAQEIRNAVLVSAHSTVKILEVGAGTGSTSTFVLEKLVDLQKKIVYVYSDVSAGFVHYGKEKLKRFYPFIEGKVFNIEKEPEEQGFEKESYDIIFASNVMHIANAPVLAIKRIYSLLGPEGRLYINELTQFKAFSTCTFGLTLDWWASPGNQRIRHSPLLDENMWKKVMEQAGFLKTSILPKEKWMNRESLHIILGIKYLQSGAAADHIQKEALKWVKEEFAAALMIPVTKIEGDVKVELLGVDSLITIEIHKKWSGLFPKIPASLLFEYDTPVKVAHYLVWHYEKELRKILQLEDEEKSEIRKSFSGDDIAVIGHHSFGGNTVLGTSYISMLFDDWQKGE